MTLIDHFDKGVQRDPAVVFAADSREARTYREVQLCSFRFANMVQSLGFGPGTRIATLAENSVSHLVCAVGIARTGCVWAPVSTKHSLEGAIAALDGVEAELLIYCGRHSATAYQAVQRCGTLRKSIRIDGPDSFSPGLDALLKSSGTTDPCVERGGDDIVTLCGSGGTTGTPKGVMMTNDGWETYVASVMTRYDPHPVHLVTAPLAHAAGGVALALSALGATTVLLEKFEPIEVMRAIGRHRVTHLFLPPTAIRLLLRHPEVRSHDYSSLRFFVFGGEPMTVETLKEAMAVFGPVMATAFGQTESNGDVTFLSPKEIEDALATGRHERLRSCGRATPFVRVAVMADDGRLLGDNEIGELVVQSNQVMKGYFKNEAETIQVSAFGWHHTGDLGYRDEDGYYYLVDRKRDVIIAGGLNVFPSEIENVICRHPAIRDCAVVGLPHPDWGELPVAVVEPRAVEIDIDDLTLFCSKILSPLQMPRAFHAWPTLPRGPGGKVARRAVREHLEREQAAPLSESRRGAALGGVV